MTHPRYILRDNTLMVTRRTLRRHHLFRPDPAIRQLYLYTLAVCARQCGVLVHAVTLMSTHEHLVVTDPEGQLPDFLHRLHRLVALGTKKLRKWEGSTWDHQRPSVVRLLTDQAIIEKLAYVMANPVKAGLVRRARDWPGITVLPNELGRRTWRIERPDYFFDPKNSKWPETVELSITIPPSLEQSYLPDQIRKAVSQELQNQEKLAAEDVRMRGLRVLGSQRVRRLSPGEEPDLRGGARSDQDVSPSRRRASWVSSCLSTSSGGLAIRPARCPVPTGHMEHVPHARGSCPHVTQTAV